MDRRKLLKQVGLMATLPMLTVAKSGIEKQEYVDVTALEPEVIVVDEELDEVLLVDPSAISMQDLYAVLRGETQVIRLRESYWGRLSTIEPIRRIKLKVRY